jgi:ABC-type ATPase involved in cell division
MTVAVAFAMEVSGDPTSIIQPRVMELLAKVGLNGREKAYPSQLSGGERARAAIARALVHKPMIVIADEPTGNIDPVQSLEILKLLQDVNREGVTVLLATHDDEIVDKLQTRVLRLENGALVRDSIGGYNSGVPTQPILEKKSHKVFDKEEQEVVAQETKSAPKEEVPQTGGRKIKPIAI